MGGRALVFPCVQTIQRLPLNTMTLEVKTTKVYTAQVDIIYNISTVSTIYLHIYSARACLSPWWAWRR